MPVKPAVISTLNKGSESERAWKSAARGSQAHFCRGLFATKDVKT